MKICQPGLGGGVRHRHRHHRFFKTHIDQPGSSGRIDQPGGIIHHKRYLMIQAQLIGSLSHYLILFAGFYTSQVVQDFFHPRRVFFWGKEIQIWGFLKWWYPTTMGFLLKMIILGVFWGPICLNWFLDVHKILKKSKKRRPQTVQYGYTSDIKTTIWNFDVTIIIWLFSSIITMENTWKYHLHMKPIGTKQHHVCFI